MIKLTVKELVDSVEAFQTIMQQELKGSFAFRCARLKREVLKELEIFENQRDALVQKYALRDENGEIIKGENENTIRLDPQKIDECDKEYQAILDVEVEINAEKFRMEDADAFNITPQQMEYLLPFFEEE